MRPNPLLLVLPALGFFVTLGLVGGAGQPWDEGLVLFLQAWRTANLEATGWAIFLTHAGGAPFLLSVAGVGAAWLWLRGERCQLLRLGLTVLGGRAGVEIIKLAVDRPRPAFDAHPVIVFSQSFPSGHAANSMLTYLGLALFVAPERWRRPCVLAAVLLALSIGATRPFLGVHWPTDVLGGWIYGCVVAWLVTGLSCRRQSEA